MTKRLNRSCLDELVSVCQLLRLKGRKSQKSIYVKYNEYIIDVLIDLCMFIMLNTAIGSLLRPFNSLVSHISRLAVIISTELENKSP